MACDAAVDGPGDSLKGCACEGWWGSEEPRWSVHAPTATVRAATASPPAPPIA